MATAKKTPKKSYEVQVTYTNVIAYATVAADSLQDALAQSANLKLGTMLADGLDNLLDWDGRVSGVFES